MESVIWGRFAHWCDKLAFRHCVQHCGWQHQSRLQRCGPNYAKGSKLTGNSCPTAVSCNLATATVFVHYYYATSNFWNNAACSVCMWFVVPCYSEFDWVVVEMSLPIRKPHDRETCHEQQSKLLLGDLTYSCQRFFTCQVRWKSFWTRKKVHKRMSSY